jgi:hypothetical protein
MKKTLIIALLAGGFVLAADASVITSVSVTGGDTYAIPTWPSGTFMTGDFVDFARIQGGAGGRFTNANRLMPAFGNLAPSHTDRRQQYVGYNSTGTLGSGNAELNGANIPSYLLGLPYIATMNDNRDNASLSLTVSLAFPTRAYLFVDTRYGDGVDQTAPTLAGTPMNSWLTVDGWAPMITGAKPSDYTGPGDIIGLSASPNNVPNFGPNSVTGLTLNQYSEIWFKDITGTSFTLGAFGPGQSYNIFGVVVVPEPGSFGVAALGSALLLIFRRRR